MPGKNAVFDKTYEGDQFSYQFQQEEKSLQDQLFDAYDKAVDDPSEEEDE